MNRSEQARINGAKSQGPVTPEGKAASSRNATKHGLTSELPPIDDAYDAVRTRWTHQLRPITEAEVGLVNRIAAAEWRLEKIVDMQTALLNHEVETRAQSLQENHPDLDDAGLLAVAFRDATNESNAMDLLRRYETMLDRSIARNIKLFHELKDRRLKEFPPAIRITWRDPSNPDEPHPMKPILIEPESPGLRDES